MRTRLAGGVADQLVKAVFAEATAFSTISLSANPTWPMTLPVAGLCMSRS